MNDMFKYIFGSLALVSISIFSYQNLFEIHIHNNDPGQITEFHPTRQSSEIEEGTSKEGKEPKPIQAAQKKVIPKPYACMSCRMGDTMVSTCKNRRCVNFGNPPKKLPESKQRYYMEKRNQ